MKNGARLITPEEIKSAEDQIVAQSKRIDFYITEYSVEILASKMANGEYVVPSYQRNFTWEHDRKSKFIESLIMGLPIPFVFFWEMEDGRLEIVDGSQRLRTIEEFLLKDLQLGDLEQLSEISQFHFSDLLESRQRKIRNRSIRGIVLNEHADEAARLDMFERINTGSKIANRAEVRRGALAGRFMDMVIELAEDTHFHLLAPMSQKSRDERGYEELVTRFFAYGDGLTEYGLDTYKDKPSDFIFNYTKAKNRDFMQDENLADEYRKRFHETLDFVAKAFPHGFRKKGSGNATPRARFEAIAVGSYLALLNRSDLKSDPRKADVKSWLQGDEFIEITVSDGANARARLESRINFVRDRLVNS